MLEDDVERPPGSLRIQFLYAENTQRSRPVEDLGDARRLSEIELTKPRNEACNVTAQPFVQLGHFQADDLRFSLRRREIQVQMQVDNLLAC